MAGSDFYRASHSVVRFVRFAGMGQTLLVFFITLIALFALLSFYALGGTRSPSSKSKPNLTHIDVGKRSSSHAHLHAHFALTLNRGEKRRAGEPRSRNHG